MCDSLLLNIKDLIDKHLDERMKETNYLLSQIPFVKKLILDNSRMKDELKRRGNITLEINDKKENIDFLKYKEMEPWDKEEDDDSAKNEDIVASNMKYLNRKKQQKEEEEEEVEEEEVEEEEEEEEVEVEEEEEEEEVEVEEEEDEEEVEGEEEEDYIQNMKRKMNNIL